MQEENLVLRQHVRITASVPHPTGGGARDPCVLLNETAHCLGGRPLFDFDQSRTYNTYDGQNQTNDRDWYAIEFPQAATCNCIELTMGMPYRDGGWWTSLDIEARADTGEWYAVENLAITPPYNFDDTRCERRPYETYALTFNALTTKAVRLAGCPGGLAQFTSLARLSAYHRDLSHWNPTSLPDPPVPYIFRLISPQTIWDLSENLAKLTGLVVVFPLMENYLDEQRYQRLWQRIRRNYQGEPDLGFLLGESIGWEAWRRIGAAVIVDHPIAPGDPHIRLSFYNTLASAVAPVVIDGQVLGEMTTRSVILKDTFDWEWHRRYAQAHNISWPAYQAAINRSPQMTREQLAGAAALMGLIANTIANLAHHTRSLERELDGVRSAIDQRAHERKEIVRKAIDLMQEKLEAPIHVADVARALALSPSYFSTLFTEQTGHNPSEFLIDLRLERAKEYLAHTTMSVMEVCVALGYDPSYFSRLFKRRTGSTPGAYAQRMRTG